MKDENELNLNEIAEYIRKKYPKAIQVVLTVGYHGHKVAVEEYHNTTGFFTHRTLDGKWLEADK